MSLFRGKKLISPAINLFSKSRFGFAHKLADSTKKEEAALPFDFYRENCILVDKNDQAIGSASKKDCHSVNGDNILLHRAFSVFLFNQNGDMLLQKRSSHKVFPIPSFNESYRSSPCVSVVSSSRFRKFPFICIIYAIKSSDVLSSCLLYPI